MFNHITPQKNTGFTLIEMLVSIALFSVVLTVTLGSIMTIVDSNKKARSLMSVTNNLNFAVDSMVRSFKTGEAEDGFAELDGGECFSTFEIDYAGAGDSFDKREVEYCFDDIGDSGKITKQIKINETWQDPVELTSSDVDIDSATFIDSSYNDQPMLSIVLKGTVKVSERVSSSFSIQTSASQRKLNI